MTKLLDAVRQAIKASGKSRYAIAKATGIDQAQLSRLMSGDGGLGLESLTDLCDYLDLEIVLRKKSKKGG